MKILMLIILGIMVIPLSGCLELAYQTSWKLSTNRPEMVPTIVDKPQPKRSYPAMNRVNYDRIDSEPRIILVPAENYQKDTKSDKEIRFVTWGNMEDE